MELCCVLYENSSTFLLFLLLRLPLLSLLPPLLHFSVAGHPNFPTRNLVASLPGGFELPPIQGGAIWTVAQGRLPRCFYLWAYKRSQINLWLRLQTGALQRDDLDKKNACNVGLRGFPCSVAGDPFVRSLSLCYCFACEVLVWFCLMEFCRDSIHVSLCQRMLFWYSKTFS